MYCFLTPNYRRQVEIMDPKKKKEKETMEQASFIQIMRENNTYEIICICIGTFGAALNGATMPVFAVLFSEVIGVSFTVLSVCVDTTCF